MTTYRSWIVNVRRAALLIATIGVTLPGAAFGQGFPQRTVQIVVPFPAGGITDALARILAQRLGERWGRPVVVENKGGGLTIPGTAAVALAAPDCHTILLSGTMVPVNALSGRKLPYDTKTQLAPLTYFASVPTILVVPPSSPFNSVSDLVAHAKENPGRLNYGSTGAGGTSHLAAELFAAAAGIELTHVPYRGGAAAAIDLLAGRLDLMFDSSSAENVSAGQLRALAVGSERRMQAFPELPTMRELGYPGFLATSWVALWTTGGSPSECVRKISQDVNEVMRSPTTEDLFRKLGTEVRITSPEEASQFIASEMTRWGELMRARELKFE